MYETILAKQMTSVYCESQKLLSEDESNSLNSSLNSSHRDGVWVYGMLCHL